MTTILTLQSHVSQTLLCETRKVYSFRIRLCNSSCVISSLDKWKRKGSFRQFYNHSITDSILNVNNTAVILTLYSHASYKRLCDSCNALQGNNGTTGKPGIPGRAGLKVSTILLPQG